MHKRLCKKISSLHGRGDREQLDQSLIEFFTNYMTIKFLYTLFVPEKT